MNRQPDAGTLGNTWRVNGLSKSHGLIALSVAAAVAVLFGPAISGRYGFAYRDAAHFYHPLFEFVQAEWSAGRVPLWNPYENLGQPLAGDATSSVFYPGKLLFALPLDFTLLFNLYVVAHVALAAYTSFRLARRLGTSTLAAGLAAFAYAFSGDVLFQYSNVVFLVGAAWLPLALELGDRMLRARSWRAALAAGVVLGLMVTGGDPQMAYNAVLLVGLEALILWCTARREQPAEASSSRRPISRYWTLLALSAISGVLVSAVQVFPSWQTTRLSSRAAYDAPRNVSELAAVRLSSEPHDDKAPWYSGLIGASADEHTNAVYQFNVGPWRAIEFLWPNASGRHFPVNTRWLDVLPAEGRVWTPTLYLGLLPFVLAVASFSLRRTAPTTRWLSWLTLLSALAGTGVFGIMWWLREVAGWFGGSLDVSAGDEVGGLYWLMTIALPGYVYFRYPAKLLVVTSLGLAMLAAIGWDRLWASRSPRRWKFFAALAIVSGLACLALNLTWPSILARLQTITPNELFGPFDGAQARIEITQSLLHTAVVSVLLAVLLRFAASQQFQSALPLAPGESPGARVPIACLLLTALELVIANRTLVQYAPTDAWQDASVASTLLNQKARVYREPHCWNNAWRDASSPDRLLENLAWERATLFPKYNLPPRIALVESKGTFASFDVQILWDVVRDDAATNNSLPGDSILRLAAVSHLIAPDRSLPGGSPLAPGVSLLPLENVSPRAWIVHDVRVLSELADPSPSRVRQRTSEVLFPVGQSRDWSREAVVETDTELPEFAAPATDAPPESCQIIDQDPDRVEIVARLTSPGLVILADAYYPGWTLSVETDGVTRDAEILRTNRVLRGVALPAGQHRLVYQYRPATFYFGAATSAVSLLALVVIAAVTRRKKSPGRAGG